MRCNASVIGLLSALAFPESTEACSVSFVPWQQRAVWPTRERTAPVNAHVYVHIPAPLGTPLLEPRAHAPRPELSGRIGVVAEEPVSAIARALSLREVTGPDGAAAAVPTRWRARRDDRGIVVELVPLVPLRSHAEHFVQAETRDGPERLGPGFRTGQQQDARAPVWPGILRAVYVPLRKSAGASGDCSSLLDQGPQAELALHAATDEGAVRFAVWLARPGEALRYEDTPRAYLTPDRDRLPVEDLPRGAPRLRIGVRAVDAAGNRSPPSEIEMSVPPGEP